MPTSYTTLLGLALPVTGELSGTWGDTVNNYITQYVDAAVAGAQIISGSQTAVTLSTTNGTSLSQAGSGATGSSQYAIIRCTGNPGSLLTITAPAANKVYLIINATSTSQSVKIVGTGPTTGVTIAASRAALVAWNGSDFVLIATTDITQLSGTLAITNGGTGATTNSGARTNLGATTVGSNLFTLANPSAITFPRINADNTVSTLDAATFRTAIGAGTGNGTVTSVTGTSPVASSGGTTPAISLSSAYGDTQNPYGSKTANFFLAAPNGTAGAPTFRAVVAADIPTLNQNTTGTAANVTGTVAVANGGTGSTTQSGARTNLGATTVGSNFFTLTNPTAITFPRINADNTVSTLDAATFRTAIGAGTGSGTVTSVGMTVPAFLSVSGSPVTSSGTLAVTLSGTALPVANGGTGATTLTANNVLLGNGTSAVQVVAPSTSGNVLTSNGTTWQSTALPATVSGPNAQVFTSGGTFTVPTGVTKLYVSVWAGGGGGAGGSSSSTLNGGRGGRGGFGTALITGLTPGASITVTVGGGGNAGNGASTGGNGSSGSTSSFGSYLSCTGGAGGVNNGTAGANGTPTFTGATIVNQGYYNGSLWGGGEVGASPVTADYALGNGGGSGMSGGGGAGAISPASVTAGGTAYGPGSAGSNGSGSSGGAGGGSAGGTGGTGTASASGGGGGGTGGVVVWY